MKVIVFTGAGVSAESGLKTFRDAGGLWEGHDVMEVASPEGYRRDPGLVLSFYNERRRQLKEVEPNEAHLSLAKLETVFDVTVITQNVDDLHERAGSSRVVHLHGELKKARSTGNPDYIRPIDGDINVGDLCPYGHQLRPHIVWFGEAVPMIEKAAALCTQADIFLVIGTSLQVYPAAGLLQCISATCEVYYIDPNPHSSIEFSRLPVRIIAQKAAVAVPMIVERLIKER